MVDSYNEFDIVVHLRLGKKLSKESNESLDNRKLQPENNVSSCYCVEYKYESFLLTYALKPIFFLAVIWWWKIAYFRR
jgi:hypothetical protein